MQLKIAIPTGGTAGSRWPAALLAGLLVLGLAMRVWGAWVYEFAHTSDHGIICLMVKHMLEGKGFLVFFYGLPYMGSIEPVISVALCTLFGLNGFWINMGTAVVAFAFLPLVYLWGRGVAGRTAGLAALAFCAIGPPQYFQMESWADGGYAAIPLLTCAVLVLSLRMLARELRGEKNSHAHFLLLGVVAGLGWWQSPLLIPAFLTSALLFLAVMRLRLFTLRLVTCAAGFFLGSLPLWIWNVRHHWQTFDMVKTYGRPSLVEGLKIFYLRLIPDVFGLFSYWPVLRIAIGALLALLAALAFARLRAARRGRARGEVLGLSAAFLYVLIYSVLFGQSRFAYSPAPRYGMMLIPVLGVLAGAATAWLTARVRWGLGWLPLAALLTLQAVELPHYLTERRKTESFMPVAREFAGILRERKITHLYAAYQVRRANHGLNFLLNEEFVFSPLSRERVPGYARALEQAEHPAVLNSLMGFPSFLAATRATARTAGVHGMTVHYDARPPSDGWQLLRDSEIASISAPGRPDLAGELRDGSTRTGWTALPGLKGSALMQVRLVTPRRLVGVRLISEGGAYPHTVGVEAWNEASRRWMTVLPVSPVTRFYWSGPRFYWGEAAYRLEYRFDSVETARLRLRVAPLSREAPCRIQELQVFAEDETASACPGKEELDRLAEVIRERALTRVYSDRWEANGLYARVGTEVQLSLPPHVVETEVLSAELTMDEKTAIVVRQREAELTRSALSKRGLVLRETEVGPWRLFDFPEGASLSPLARTPCLRWAGFGCLLERDRDWAVIACRSAQALLERKAWADGIALGQSALLLDPDNRALLQTLAACYEGSGEAQKAAEFRRLAEAAWKPAISAPARFEGGLELLGVTCAPSPAAGAPFHLKLYWRCPPRADVDGLVVFVHFKAGESIVFQGDHPFLASVPQEADRAGDAVLVEDQIVNVPADVAPGEVRIELGIYIPARDGRRLKVKTDFGRGRKVVVIPVPLTVAPPTA